MPEIFQQATCTLAFLGADEESNLAIQTLMQIGLREDLEPESSQWPEDLPRCPLSWGEQGVPSAEDPVWGEVMSLFRRPWFRRAWVVQEIIVASNIKVVCGQYNIQWDDLVHVMERVRKALLTTEIDQSAWEPFLALNELRRWEKKSVRWPILRLLESFRHVDSKLRRDRFYALLGIASDGHLEDFEPNYHCPFELVVQKFASALIVRLIKDGSAMELLYRAGMGSDPGRFPSWMPDWTTKQWNCLHESSGRGVTYGASEARPERIECVFGPGGLVNELRIEGYFVDEIEKVSDVANESHNRLEFFWGVEKMLGTKKMRSVYTDDALQKLLWKVPIADSMHPEVASSSDVSLETSYEAFRKRAKRARHAQRYKTMPKQREREKPYLSVLDKFPGWRFIITKKRSLCGIAPNNVQARDKLYVFSGGDVPFVLRESQDRKGAFQLVGGCYVSGIMYGQALEFEDVTKTIVSIH
ncbi:hypothetical protein ONZ43_g6928 [Nemania bipapillata]|uniref:Uncharacterized protein n=1 Tax=Nemania bipapillata TaxID=110536 RepID=A0ACC2HVA9_9PEZI|nr:hypothetical protein ONZ43_g6928 [Nemania bipapillata]